MLPPIFGCHCLLHTVLLNLFFILLAGKKTLHCVTFKDFSDYFSAWAFSSCFAIVTIKIVITKSATVQYIQLGQTQKSKNKSFQHKKSKMELYENSRNQQSYYNLSREEHECLFQFPCISSGDISIGTRKSRPACGARGKFRVSLKSP